MGALPYMPPNVIAVKTNILFVYDPVLQKHSFMEMPAYTLRMAMAERSGDPQLDDTEFPLVQKLDDSDQWQRQWTSKWNLGFEDLSSWENT